MLAQRLIAAAKVIDMAGKQAELVLDTLQAQITDALMAMGIEATLDNIDNSNDSDRSWVRKAQTRNLLLKKPKKSKYKKFIALQVTLYYEEEALMVDKWEPMLYLPVSPVDFAAGPYSYDVCTVSDSDNRICFYPSDDESKQNPDCWFVAAPLVELSDQKILKERIVDPLIPLIKLELTDIRSQKLPTNDNLFFCFINDGDTFRLER